MTDKSLSPERFKTTKKVTFGMSSTFEVEQQSKSSKVGAYDNFKIYNDTSSDDSVNEFMANQAKNNE